MVSVCPTRGLEGHWLWGGRLDNCPAADTENRDHILVRETGPQAQPILEAVASSGSVSRGMNFTVCFMQEVSDPGPGWSGRLLFPEPWHDRAHTPLEVRSRWSWLVAPPLTCTSFLEINYRVTLGIQRKVHPVL